MRISYYYELSNEFAKVYNTRAYGGLGNTNMHLNRCYYARMKTC